MSSLTSFLRRWYNSSPQQTAESAAREVPQPLPAVEALNFDADFSPFMQSEVAQDIRCCALRRLFMTDHYRSMDGLDVYVDDYSAPTPLSAAVLASLEHARSLLPPVEETPAITAVEPPE